MDNPLLGGALPLTDDRPRRSHPISAVLPGTVAEVNRYLPFNSRVKAYYAQRGPLCVAYSTSQLMTFHNGWLYHPGWLYAKAGGDGTRGVPTGKVLDIVRGEGHVSVRDDFPPPAPETLESNILANPEHRIKEFRWLSQNGTTAVDEGRTAISIGLPFLFIFPSTAEGMGAKRDVGEDCWWYYIEDEGITYPASGWHQVCVNAASDDGGYFETINSNNGAPLRFTYDIFRNLIDHGSYGVTVTDTITGTERSQPVDPPVPPSYACPRCKKTFSTKEKRRKHIKRRHS